MNTDPQSNHSVTEALKSAVRESREDQTLTGAKLGFVARQASPGFSPKASGFRTLKEYIQRFVPELVIVGYAGVDPVYGLRSPGEEPPQPPKPAPVASAEPSCWRVWVSPECGRLLVVDRDTGDVKVSSEDSSISSDAVSIPPASANFHVEVARQFLRVHQEIPASLRQKLEALIAGAQDGWWRPWTSLIKEQGAFLSRNWNRHRVGMLVSKFEEALKSHGLEEKSLIRASAQVRPGQPKARPRTFSSAGESPSSHQLIDVVMRIIPTLSVDEIRDLRLPLGKVCDAIAAASRAQ
ncbi:MAG: hypothetical protein H7A48_06765 [Akkermansiaceae bacterium]|nr:hypothetical protein [Akkermansiaceae bacterium]